MRRLIVAAIATACAIVAPVPSQAANGVPTFSHVFVIVGENTSLSQLTMKNATYQLGTIKPNSAWLTDYWGISHYSTSKYIAMTSGQFLPCHQADEKPATCNQDVPNVFGQLSGASTPISWKAWNESMPQPGCYLVNAGENRFGNAYRVKHNPAAYYEDVVGSNFSGTTGDAFCQQHDVSMGTTDPNDKSTFEADLRSGDIPRFNYITPNMCEDGHDNCKPEGNTIKQFDDFLAREVPKIMASPAWDSNSVIFVVYDEGQDGGPGKAVKFAGGNVPFAVIGDLVHNAQYTETENHYNLLRTIEDGFGLGPVPAVATSAPITQIWK
jgi:hypothetical protein